MNQQELWNKIKENSYLLEFRMRQNSKLNKCGFPGSFAHATKIFQICYELNALGYQFYTEAKFKTVGRADIFIPELSVAIEVLETEQDKSILEKQEKYPCRIVALHTTDKFTEELIC